MPDGGNVLLSPISRRDFRNMTYACLRSLKVLAAFVAFVLPQYSSAAQKEDWASCDSPFIQGLMNAQVVGSPQDDVWVLLALDKVEITKACQGLAIETYASYLERLWLNDVMEDQIPAAKTVAEAIKIEHEMESSASVTLEKIRQRAHTRSFSIEVRKQADSLPRGAEEPPQSDSRKARNIWPSRTMSPPGIAVAMAFTNITQRKIFWPSTDLFIKEQGAEKYVWFHCESEERHIAPSERFVVFCAATATDWRSDEEGLALLEGLKYRDNWFLRPDDTRHYWPTYRRIMHELMTQQSAQKAIDYIEDSSCISRGSCSEEFDRSPLMDNLVVKFLKFWIAWLPGLILGAVLFAALRRLSSINPIRIALTLSGVLIAAAGFGLYVTEKTPGLGWGGLLIIIWVIAACIGSLLGVWLLYLLSTVRGRRGENPLTTSVLGQDK